MTKTDKNAPGFRWSISYWGRMMVASRYASAYIG